MTRREDHLHAGLRIIHSRSPFYDLKSLDIVRTDHRTQCKTQRILVVIVKSKLAMCMELYHTVIPIGIWLAYKRQFARVRCIAQDGLFYSDR